ncbi:MAG: hypothetical protein QOC64_2651 [Solirubrobacteraceae bacterium]|jgi:uncharacterized protein YndB with AHSA1/START domain|nr:hypothetical protein [Solirubrobacteraceae bacterium]
MTEELTVDVVTEIEIARPREEVAAFASDPDNAMRWYKNIKSTEWVTTPPLRIGSQIAFVAKFLGSRLDYTYEVHELVPGELFVMRTEEGPFPMQTTYTWEDAPGGGTRMTLRNSGEPKRFSKATGKVIANAMRRANRKDLERLKEVLESES